MWELLLLQSPATAPKKLLDGFGGDDENYQSVGNPKRKV
jgi:hypothetical protein